MINMLVDTSRCVKHEIHYWLVPWTMQYEKINIKDGLTMFSFFLKNSAQAQWASNHSLHLNIRQKMISMKILLGQYI